MKAIRAWLSRAWRANYGVGCFLLAYGALQLIAPWGSGTPGLISPSGAISAASLGFGILLLVARLFAVLVVPPLLVYRITRALVRDPLRRPDARRREGDATAPRAE